LASPEWRWLWPQVRPFIGYQIAGVVVVLLSTATALTMPLLMKWLIDDILPGRQWAMLIVVTGLFCGVSVGRAALGSVGGMINMLGVMRCAYRIRKRLIGHLLALPPAFYKDKPVGDLVQRVESDVSAVGDFGSDMLPTVVQMVAQTVMTIAVMVFLDWRLTIIVVPTMPLFVWVNRYYRSTLKQNSEIVRDASGKQSSLLNEVLTGVTQIQLLGTERRMARHYDRLSLRSQRARWGQRLKETGFSISIVSVVSLASALIIGYGGARVMQGSLTAGSLVAFYGYVGSVLAPLMTATDLYARLNRIQASIGRLREIEEGTDDLRDDSEAIGISAAPQQVTCNNVSFRYDDDKRALASVDFAARAGERVAVIGASGCGKSSLLKLIPRLYDAEDGLIAVDGVSLKALRLRSLRHSISFVPQEPMLFQGTVLENLRHGQPTASAREIDRALSIACLTEVVRNLPDGINAKLGPMGSGLSGGERQRVAIARAILQDRPIVILDEATSALDAPTEHVLLENLSYWSARRIVIVASHRPAACVWADRVVVFERGQVVESGPHDVLNRHGTFYFNFWQNGGSPVSSTSGQAMDMSEPA
jgi:ABC-type bacteriocin/lantibiotic exporter with double-glycine peptidase domain